MGLKQVLFMLHANIDYLGVGVILTLVIQVFK